MASAPTQSVLTAKQREDEREELRLKESRWRINFGFARDILGISFVVSAALAAAFNIHDGAGSKELMAAGLTLLVARKYDAE